MEYLYTEIPGVVVMKPRKLQDARGYFMETFRQDEFAANVCKTTFVQDNQSSSHHGVVRGLHFQKPPFAQSKLVRCIQGQVLDVIVDLRNDSPTFGNSISVLLDAEEATMVFLPRGMAHGFAVLSDMAVFQYKCDAYYAPQAEGGISPLSAVQSMEWRIPSRELKMSDKDLKLPEFDFTQTYFTGNLYD